MPDRNKSWLEYFRLITPFMLVILSFVGWTMNGRLEKIDANISAVDDKLFKHLTNDELHTPRTMVVSQEAFTLYQTMRDKEMATMAQGICDIKDILLMRDKRK